MCMSEHPVIIWGSPNVAVGADTCLPTIGPEVS